MFIGGIAALPALWPPVEAAEPLARDARPPAHSGYISTGADDDRTVVRNHDAFSHYEIRAFRFSDLRHMDTTRPVFGSPWVRPVYLSAVSGMRALHPTARRSLGMLRHRAHRRLSRRAQQ
jgi:isopentenyl diphosphate isomerase/L-lactate dehydrogenase-like FMN-dependent dehydrogenase